MYWNLYYINKKNTIHVVSGLQCFIWIWMHRTVSKLYYMYLPTVESDKCILLFNLPASFFVFHVLLKYQNYDWTRVKKQANIIILMHVCIFHIKNKKVVNRWQVSFDIYKTHMCTNLLRVVTCILLLPVSEQKYISQSPDILRACHSFCGL